MAQTILVPVDFEEGSERALDVAHDLATRLGARLVLLHAYTLPVYAYPGMAPIQAPTLDTEIEAAAKQALGVLAARWESPRTLLRQGDPATVILDAIEELEPALVVMGTHGRRGLQRLVLGSVAEHVARRSKVPVMTVRPQVASDTIPRPA